MECACTLDPDTGNVALACVVHMDHAREFKHPRFLRVSLFLKGAVFGVIMTTLGNIGFALLGG